MRLNAITVSVLTVVLFGLCAISRVSAQDTSTASGPDTERCARWLKAILNGPVLHDPGRFCSGLLGSDHMVGWDGGGKCPQIPGETAVSAPQYCASNGMLTDGETLAVGIRAASPDGRELLDGAAPAPNDPARTSAILYSRTDLWIGTLRARAGMYTLLPYRSTDGWKLAIGRLAGDDWDAEYDPKQILGTVAMETVALDDLPEAIPTTPQEQLHLAFWPVVWNGPVPVADRNVSELDFWWGSTNVFVRIRPDQVHIDGFGGNGSVLSEVPAQDGSH